MASRAGAPSREHAGQCPVLPAGPMNRLLLFYFKICGGAGDLNVRGMHGPGLCSSVIHPGITCNVRSQRGPGKARGRLPGPFEESAEPGPTDRVPAGTQEPRRWPAGPLGDLKPSARPLRPRGPLLPRGPGRVTWAADSILWAFWETCMTDADSPTFMDGVRMAQGSQPGTGPLEDRSLTVPTLQACRPLLGAGHSALVRTNSGLAKGSGLGRLPT